MPRASMTRSADEGRRSVESTCSMTFSRTNKPPWANFASGGIHRHQDIGVRRSSVAIDSLPI